MRLAKGIVVDAEKTLGALKFSAMRREKMVEDEEGNSTGEVKERTYDLRSRGQGMMVQVGIPASVPVKNIPAGTPVVLVNPVFNTVTTARYNAAEVDWYIKADDIVPAGAATSTSGKGDKPADNVQKKVEKEPVKN